MTIMSGAIIGGRLGAAGRDSLQLAGLELLDSDTYQVLDGQRGFGDPQIVVDKIRSELGVGSFVTGDATDNRTITLQVLISASSRAKLAEADSTLRTAVNASGTKTLVWTPAATGLPLVFEVYRGQVQTAWSKKWEAAGCRVVTITMDALPFGRSDTRQTVSGSSSSVQIGDFTLNPEYTYHVPDGAAQSAQDGSAATGATVTKSGTVYAPQVTPAPVDGASCMRMDFGTFYSTRSLTYVNVAEVDTVTATLDLSTYSTIELLYSFNGAFVQSNSVYFDLTLTDISGRSVTVEARQVDTQVGLTWRPILWSADDFSSIDLKNVASWKLRIWTFQSSLKSVWLGLLRAYPSISSQASTTHGAVYKLPGVIGDARAEASIAIDRGGTNTITGFLTYRAPKGTPATTPSLVGLTSNAGSTTAPSTFNGTYRVLLANAGGSNIAAGGTLTITQKIGATTVATKTLTTTAVAGGSLWADCGDVTLPLVDIPGEATNVTYAFSFSATATEVLLCDTRGFLAWVPVCAAVKYVWVDETTPAQAGGVFGGASSDRSDATSLLALTGAQIAGTPSLQPGDNYVLVYVIDGAASNVTLTYFDRWLGDRAVPDTQAASFDIDAFTDVFLDAF
jgi:hypothetical protein